MANTISPHSRRKFLKTTGSAALFIGASGMLPITIACNDFKKVNEQLEKFEVTAWVQLSQDGQIIIYNPAAEMGQGSMTALPALFAEEMDADWSKVKVAFSPQEADLYGSIAWNPNIKVMISAGSRVTKGYYPIMRNAGAQARHILLYSVAKKWEVPIGELTTENGVVVHEKQDKRISYGEIVPFLEIPETLPEFTEAQLKNPKDYRLVGKNLKRTDIPQKVTGAAQFAIDVRLPDMLYGVLERGKVHGAKPTLTNANEILAMEGVLKIVPLDYAIGIVAESLEQALTAKQRLEIKWGKTAANTFDSQEIFGQYVKIADQPKKGNVLFELGSVENAKKKAYKNFSIDFKNDYVYHAQMEPLNSVVRVAEDQKSAEVWVGSQQGGADTKLGVPELLGIPQENVNVHLQYLGGGFGRRSMNDFVIECALLAKEMAPRPVKLIWTREDDLTYGAFRPLTLQRLSASTDINGYITGLSHCVIGDGGNLVASGIENKYYAIPNQLAEWREVSHGIRLKHWRSVGHGPNKFAIEGLLDEVAHYHKLDPMELRRKLMSKAPRALATLEKAAEIALWNSPSEKGRAKGVAFLERSGTLSTGICEISVNRSTGKIKVHKFWNALDAGIVVQPDNVKAQMEGGIIMGISSVLKERITIKNGAVQQSNYHDYEILRMMDIPESIETAIIESTEPPQGVGESGTPLVACAIANAFLSLTGKRLRHLPFTPDRVLEALNT